MRATLRGERRLRVAEPLSPLDPRLCYPVGDVEALAHAIRRAAKHRLRPGDVRLIEKFDFAEKVEAIEWLWGEVSGQRPL